MIFNCNFLQLTVFNCFNKEKYIDFQNITINIRANISLNSFFSSICLALDYYFYLNKHIRKLWHLATSNQYSDINSIAFEKMKFNDV